MTRRKERDVLLAVTAARRFEKSGDPVDAWRAISFALANNRPLPELARDYLLDVARKIEALSPGNTDRDVAAALGLQGRRGRSPFDGADRAVHDFVLAFEVWRRDREMPPEAKVVRTFEAVAADHPESCPSCAKRLTHRGVEKAWYAHYREVVPAHLRAQFPPDVPPSQLLKALRTR